MSATRAVVEANIRLHLHDTNDTGYAVDSDELHLHLNAGMHDIAARAGLSADWEDDYVTLAANDFDTTLTSSIQYQRIITLRLVSRGTILERKTPSEILAMRYGNDDWPGDPLFYALHEESDQTVVLWTHPVTTAGDTLDALLAAVPAALDDDDDLIPFSDPLLRALEFQVAATIYGSMSDEGRQALGLTGDFFKTMTAMAERMIGGDRRRQARFRRTSVIPMRTVPT